VITSQPDCFFAIRLGSLTTLKKKTCIAVLRSCNCVANCNFQKYKSLTCGSGALHLKGTLLIAKIMLCSVFQDF